MVTPGEAQSGVSTKADDDGKNLGSNDVDGDFAVVFTPSGLHGRVAKGTTVLEAAREMGVDLDTVCGGRGICGRCQVQPSLGEFPKWALHVEHDALSQPGQLEHNYTGKRAIKPGNRLGCAAEICGDVVVDVPPESQIHKQVVRKDVKLDGLVIDPAIALRYVVLDERLDASGEEDGTSVDTRLIEQLAIDWEFDEAWVGTASVEPHLLSSLHALGTEATVAIRDDRIVGAWPGFVDRALGIAVDIGSTTVAGHLCDLTTGEILNTAGRMNPQIRFGEDLMSRVSYVMMNPGGRQDLTAAIHLALNELIAELIGDEHTTDRVLDLVLVGNPIMHHIALGIDPTPLGQAPFPLATSAAVNTWARDIGLDLPFASLYFAPCIAGHVGADTAAAILSEKPHSSPKVQLLVDVGTNAEIVLGNADQMFAASSPTGPAFEGAQISGGQRATAGAIERVRIDRTSLEPRFRVIGAEQWSDEPGFDAAIASTGVTGICGSGIIEVVGEMFLSGIVDTQGVIGQGSSERLVEDGRTFAYRLTDSILITQADVRAIQLAKAALRAGIDLLREHANWQTLDEVRLAGAFGAHIDPVYAMVLGLIPDCPVERVSAVGNAAGSGAVRALLSRSERQEMERVVKATTKIETATEPRFQDLFVDALGFPHTSEPNPLLAQVIDLPEPTKAAGGARRRRSGRSRGRTEEKTVEE